MGLGNSPWQPGDLGAVVRVQSVFTVELWCQACLPADFPVDPRPIRGETPTPEAQEEPGPFSAEQSCCLTAG